MLERSGSVVPHHSVAAGAQRIYSVCGVAPQFQTNQGLDTLLLVDIYTQFRTGVGGSRWMAYYRPIVEAIICVLVGVHSNE